MVMSASSHEKSMCDRLYKSPATCFSDYSVGRLRKSTALEFVTCAIADEHRRRRLLGRAGRTHRSTFWSLLEVCMGMGKTGMPWVPWDSHGNGSKISHGMGMGIKCIGMGVKTWELSPATANSLLFLHSNME